MPKVTPLHPTPAPAFRYNRGDITRALLEGLRHEEIVADVESVLADLLFLPADEQDHDAAVSAARETLFTLLEAHACCRR